MGFSLKRNDHYQCHNNKTQSKEEELHGPNSSKKVMPGTVEHLCGRELH